MRPKEEILGELAEELKDQTDAAGALVLLLFATIEVLCDIRDCQLVASGLAEVGGEETEDVHPSGKGKG